MQSTVQKIFQAIAERIAAIIGGSIGTAASTYRTICEAEQQSLLEDIAQQYEADGKQTLADNLRKQAARIQSNDPAGEATIISQQLLIGCESKIVEAPTEKPKLTDSKIAKRGRRNCKSSQDAEVDDLEDLA